MKSEQINAYTEFKQRTDRDIRQLGVLGTEVYDGETTDQQTVINLNFSIDLSIKKSILIFIDGQLLTEGTTGNYTWTNVSANVSAQITLNAPVIAGLSIKAYKIGAYQENFPNPSSVSATLLNDVAQPHKMAQAGFQPFVQKTFQAAANTQILNRALVEAGSLKAIAGEERIMFRSVTLLKSELGPSMEPVWEADNKDSRFRFVGTWGNSAQASGTRPTAGLSGNDFLEVTFYGTGLHILTNLNGATRDARYILDGGVESANFLPNAGVSAGLLDGRNYGTNTNIMVVQNLSLGWHTIKIRSVNTGAGLDIYGAIILNYRADLAVLSGTAFGGMKQEILNSLTATAWNAGVTGTSGARVVKYLLNGAISQAVQLVDATAKYLTNTDHSNEECIRRINWREFSANRTDDFSSVSATNQARGFTLDDGTTTLASSSTSGTGLANGALDLYGVSTGFTTFTFVGTGLDIYRQDNGNGTATQQIWIDGVNQGNLNTTTSTIARYERICSGLPYGTHCVRIQNVAGATASPGMHDFLVYGPKKPVLPAGAIELCDYHVMANYVANTIIGASTIGAIAKGVIRKNCTKEWNFISSGSTWSIHTGAATGLPSAWASQINAVGTGYVEFWFWGTGIEIRDYVDLNSRVTQVTIDGQTNFTTTNNSPSYGTGWSSVPTTSHYSSATDTFTASTGQISGGSTGGVYDSGTAIYGLNLGWHKLTLQRVSGTGGINYWSFDVVTPIHMNKSSFKVGSLSLADTRAFSPIIDKPEKVDLTKAKTLLYFDGVNLKTKGSLNVAGVFNSGTGQYIVFFEKPFKNDDYMSSGSMENFQYSIDNRTRHSLRVTVSNSAGTTSNNSFSLIIHGELEDEGEI